MTHELIDRSTLIAFAFGKLSREESLRVLAEIEKDDALSRDLEEVILVMRSAQEGGNGREDARRRSTITEPMLKYLVRLAAVLVLGLISAVSVSELTKGKYHDLARLDNVDFSGQWRGDGDDDIEWARREFAVGDRDAAISKLERVVRTRPAGESMNVVHCMVGAMLLATAERSVWGLFPHFEEKRTTQALGHLVLAMQSTNILVVEEAHRLRMKAFLMLNEPQEAIKEGEDVVRGGREGGAEVMMLLREIKDR